MKDLDVAIEGMHCQKCVERVKGALAKAPGVTVGEVEVGRARLRVDESVGSEQQVVQAIENAGYKANAKAR